MWPKNYCADLEVICIMIFNAREMEMSDSMIAVSLVWLLNLLLLDFC